MLQMKTLKFNFILFILCFCILPAKAQFYKGEAEPSYIKWYKVNTPNFSIIYPSGLDSLSRVYGNLLEKYRVAESWTSGYLPGCQYRKRTPVILRAYTGSPNGMVIWAPKRIELYTLPSCSGNESTPWAANLTIHELRHLSQMQFGYSRVFKPFTWIVGQIFPGLAAAIYPGLHLLEGDAVVAETALSNSGRGRSGDFLAYYKLAFDNNDYRNWYKWRYGSFKKYAPNYYALGYMTIAGCRYFYDDPMFMSKYFDAVSKNPLRLNNMQKNIKKLSGKKFKNSFQDIMTGFNSMWNEYDNMRKPFITGKKITPDSDFYVSYEDIIPIDNETYAIKSGYILPDELVKIDSSGKEKKVCLLSSNTSHLSHSGKIIYWSEPVNDIRWRMNASSRICYINLKSKYPRQKTLTYSGRLYNPAVSEDGRLLAAIEYPYTGGSVLVVLDTKSGEVINKKTAPDSLQLLSPIWIKDKMLIVSGLSNNGNGLYGYNYKNPSGNLVQLLAPVHASMKDLHNFEDGITFTSDYSGVNEIYSYNAGKVTQLTSTKYGVFCGHFNKSGTILYYTSITLDGRHIYNIKSKDLINKPVSFSSADKCNNKIADKLSLQEIEAAKASNSVFPKITDTYETKFSKPKRYYKFPNIFRLHSWVPLYVDYDNFSKSNNNFIYGTATLGLTGFFQNIEGTAYGSIGYSYSTPVFYNKGFHAAHIKFTYQGLYPVIEFRADINDRDAIKYTRSGTIKGNFIYDGVSQLFMMGKPHFSAVISTYIPLKFNYGGLLRGITPRVRYSLSNDIFDKSKVTISQAPGLGKNRPYIFRDYLKNNKVLVQKFDISLSGYITQVVPQSLSYPKLGIGAEIGYSTRPFLSNLYSSNAYVLLYGYIPGLYKTHGMKLGLLYQHHFSDNVIFSENRVTTLPISLQNTKISPLTLSAREQLKISADYPIPISVGDISCLSPITYIKNFILSPHIFYTLFSEKGQSGLSGGALSAGINLTAKLANFIWIPYGFELGLEVDWNTAYSLNNPNLTLSPKERFYIGPVIRTSF